MHLYLTVVFAVLGAAVGSFLNVVIGRLPEGLSIVSPRSRCPRCLTPIPWFENVPVLTWLLLRGRCGNCGVRISSRYIMIELLTGVLAVGLFWRFGLAWDFLVWAILSSLLIVIIFLDLDYWTIPDVVVIPGILIAAAAAFLPGRLSVLDALLGFLPALMMFATGWIFSKLTGKESLGFGDVKLLAMFGLALGLGPSLMLLLLASLQGAVVGIVVNVLGGHRDRLADSPNPVTWALEDDPELDWTPPPHAIPFGPFLALAAFEVVLLPDLFFDSPRDALLRTLGA